MSANSGVVITPSIISREKVSKFLTYMCGVNALTYHYTDRAELGELLSNAIATAFKFYQSLDAVKKEIYDFVGEDPLFTQTHQLIKIIGNVHLGAAWAVSPDVMATNIRTALAPMIDNRDAVMDAASRLRDVYRAAFEINAAATALEVNAAPAVDHSMELPQLPAGLHMMRTSTPAMPTHATPTRAAPTELPPLPARLPPLPAGLRINVRETPATPMQATPTQATAAPETSEIAQLVDMGFNSDQAAEMLHAAGGNVENAIDMILG